MEQFELRRSYRGKEICAFVLRLPEGIHISLYGGDLAHIGAVGIVDPSGCCSVTEFSRHREGVVCERWASAFADAHLCPAVVEAGIHYENLDSPGIQAVLELTDGLLEEAVRRLTQ